MKHGVMRFVAHNAAWLVGRARLCLMPALKAVDAQLALSQLLHFVVGL